MQDLTILVNTSDKFSDCWMPFFKLFHLFWPDCPYPIVLNTETKDFSSHGLNITSAQVAIGESRRLTWSECLARCLDKIETPYILYLQEDYFLEAPVQGQLIATFLDEMRAGRADVIRIMECGGSGPWQETENALLWEVDQNAKYRISMQAALWRKSTLRKHIRLHESPWQLEVFGSARARRHKDKVLCVNRDQFSHADREIIPYQPTGIVKGQWEQHIVEPLFAKHNINMDFSKRGFFDHTQNQANKRLIWARLYDRLRSLL